MDMVERVAKALEAAETKTTIESGGALGGLSDFITDEDYLILARAAIEAMREPTDEMIKACDINIPTDGMITGVWDAMIDAALKKA